jgi:RNA exonuclease 4
MAARCHPEIRLLTPVSSPPTKRKSRGKKNKKASQQHPKQDVHLLQITQEEKEQYIAIDCEMVGIGVDGQHSSLARVCMIDWDGNHLLDLYVRQRCEVTDYRTFVSGITEE